MIDLKLIREEPKMVEKKLKTKNPTIDLAPLLAIDERIRQLKTSGEELKAQKNRTSKKIGEMKQKGEETSELMEEMSQLAEKISLLDHELMGLEKELIEKLSLLPNLPMEDVPISEDPKDNVCIKSYGSKRVFSFPFKNHLQLNEHLQLFDLQRGAKTSGAGFIIYKSMGARLEWALLNYMLDIQKKNGFEQIMVPHLVREEIMYGAGQLPKFKEQLFKITDEDYHLYLIPTAEVALNGLHYDEILDEEVLPLKYVSYTPCFRREAGAAGKQERGLIRTHQFNKVEMFSFSTPEQSEKIFEMMIRSAEEVLEGLELHYRNMLLVTQDMSFGAAKTVDIEVFLPGQDRYYEVSSVSNCTDFQARRSKIRSRKKEEKPRFVHTLNGSGVATSRLMVALLENHQQEDGSVKIPSALHKYLEDEVTTLSPH